MKEELKKKMIAAIGSYPNSLIESIAEQCAQVVIDHYKEQPPIVNVSDIKSRFSDVDIAKAACKNLDIKWEEEADKYDDYRITLWSEGAAWMQKNLLNEN